MSPINRNKQVVPITISDESDISGPLETEELREIFEKKYQKEAKLFGSVVSD
jgi:hypothetical protein